MESRWLQIVKGVERPARPAVARCLEARERFLAERRLADDARRAAIAACEKRIDEERAAVFAADDGVVPASMTALEREWRRLSRRDPDEQLMTLWASIAPPHWHDRKRWRDGVPGTRVDLAVALAADVEGVEAAEAAALALRDALAAWGSEVGSRVRFQLGDGDCDATSDLLSAPSAAALARLGARGDGHSAQRRVAALEGEILAAMCAHLPERPQLARSIGHAAGVDGLMEEAGLGNGPNPVTHLSALWRLGYLPTALDAGGITLALPPP